jgi:hypothetical protein
MRDLEAFDISSGYISEIENGHRIPSKRAINIYVELGVNRRRLMDLVGKARQAEEQMDQLPDDERFEDLLCDPLADPHVLRRGYIVDHTTDTTYIGPDWVVTRMMHHAVIRSTSSNTRYVVFRDVYEEDPRPDVMAIRAASNCDLAYHEVSPHGLLYGVLELTGEPDDAGAHHLSWVVTIDSTVPTIPRAAAMAKTPLAHATQQVQFTEPALPTTLWWFRDFDPNGFRNPPTQDRLMPTNAAAWYSQDFYNLHEETCGIAWTP